MFTTNNMAVSVIQAWPIQGTLADNADTSSKSGSSSQTAGLHNKIQHRIKHEYLKGVVLSLQPETTSANIRMGATT